MLVKRNSVQVFAKLEFQLFRPPVRSRRKEVLYVMSGKTIYKLRSREQSRRTKNNAHLDVTVNAARAEAHDAPAS